MPSSTTPIDAVSIVTTISPSVPRPISAEWKTKTNGTT